MRRRFLTRVGLCVVAICITTLCRMGVSPWPMFYTCPAAVKIVTGSFHGMLRVYFPHQREYKIEDLMLEQDLGEPILQVATGRFMPYVDQRSSHDVLYTVSL